MSKPFLAALAVCLIAATAAQAQGGGGGGGGGRGGGGGGRGGGGRSQSRPAPTPATPDAPIPPPTPVNQVQIVGVIKAIDPQTHNVTIAYEAVDALNWPPGTLPFPVSDPAVLKDATIGEKIRFRLDSHRISSIQPF
jgi:hypothetical protein